MEQKSRALIHHHVQNWPQGQFVCHVKDNINPWFAQNWGEWRSQYRRAFGCCERSSHQDTLPDLRMDQQHGLEDSGSASGEAGRKYTKGAWMQNPKFSTRAEDSLSKADSIWCEVLPLSGLEGKLYSFCPVMGYDGFDSYTSTNVFQTWGDSINLIILSTTILDGFLIGACLACCSPWYCCGTMSFGGWGKGDQFLWLTLHALCSITHYICILCSHPWCCSVTMSHFLSHESKPSFSPCNMMLQSCQKLHKALDYSHSQGLMHRDVTEPKVSADGCWTVSVSYLPVQSGSERFRTYGQIFGMTTSYRSLSRVLRATCDDVIDGRVENQCWKDISIKWTQVDIRAHCK